MVAALDLIAQTFGRLKVISRMPSNIHGKVCWRCRCECGQYTVVPSGQLTTGKTKSCGCLQREAGRACGKSVWKHRMCNTPEYRSWNAMWNRCRNAKTDSFKHYGGRGITVCERWRTFQNFFSDMGLRPSSDHSIDRIDNDGNYEPGNCKWSTASEQRRNQRPRGKESAA